MREQTTPRVANSTTAGVIARPPLLFLGALLVAAMLDRWLPLPLAALPQGLVSWITAGLLILLGLAIAFAAIRGFGRAGTPVPTNRPTSALVTTGIHARTRNPIYVGMFCIYVGVAVAAASAWALVLLVPLALLIRYGVVAREEAYLERCFGEDYRQYKARVRRWV
jgi:protein-S-isoprenylcysteine O-methyltransferase Ste14